MRAGADERPRNEPPDVETLFDHDDHVIVQLGMRDVEVPEGADLAMTLPVTPG